MIRPLFREYVMKRILPLTEQEQETQKKERKEALDALTQDRLKRSATWKQKKNGSGKTSSQRHSRKRSWLKKARKRRNAACPDFRSRERSS